MYPFSMHAARTSFAVALAGLQMLLSVSACSGPTQTTHSLRIAPEVLQSSNLCEGFDGGSSAPNSVIRCQTVAGPLFATILEDCAIPERYTFQATTRQLLVGMTNMSIISQTPLLSGSTKTLHSVVRGSIDAEPVLLSLFTSRKGGCVTDLVIWRGFANSEASNEVLARFTDASRALAATLATPSDRHRGEQDDQS